MADRPVVDVVTVAPREQAPSPRRRPFAVACSTLAAALLAGCGNVRLGGGGGDGLEVLFYIFIAIAVFAVLLFVFELVVVIMNFAKPKTWTMVLGFVFGGLNLLFALLALLGAVAGATTEELAGTVFTAVTGGIFGALLLWSATRAKRVLAARR